MPLLARTIATPVAIEVRRGAVAGLAPLLADGRISSGGKVAVVVGPGQGTVIAEQLRATLPGATVIPVEPGTLESAQQVIASLREDWFDAVVGIGGGRTLDTSKYAASSIGLPFVSVATSLTHDGIASPVASLETQGRKASFGVHIPIAVFVDVDFVEKAPDRMSRSGIGDVISNLNALADWELAADVQGESIDGLASTLARTAAEALIGRQEASTDEAFLITLAEALILSGMAMAVAGTSRPCSGACHEISHAMDAMYGSPGLHGEQVALGALFAAWLRNDEALVGTLCTVIDRHGLPRLPTDLDLSDDQFAAAVIEAPRTRPGRFTILEHLDLAPDKVPALVQEYVERFSR